MATTTASCSSAELAVLRKAMKLLHSTQPSSATELRLLLDEIIKQRYGADKMLCNVLKAQHLDEETNFPGMIVPPPTPTPQPLAQQPDVDEVINLTHSPAKTISDSPDTIVDSDDAMSGAGGEGAAGSGGMLGACEDDGNLKEFGDLNCCVCGEMMFTATNRLIECSKCSMLYHQECHKPTISDKEASEDQESNWQCNNCCERPVASKPSGVVVISDDPVPLVSKTKSSATSSRSSSSSNSSSPFYKNEQSGGTATTLAPSSTASKHHHHKSSSSSKSHAKESLSKNSVSAVNVITSAEKTSSHSTSSKKTSSSHSSSTKSSTKSKHHEGSSKRKSK